MPFAADLGTLRKDRAAIEYVYYAHRLGQKPPFAQALPQAELNRLVDQDLHKEDLLRRIYGVEITSAMVEAEVRRIDATTRAPDILAEIKSALGKDPSRFANSFARPIVVERLLREKFDNDDRLHAAVRREVEKDREALLAARKTGAGYPALAAILKRDHAKAVNEVTWQLAARPPQAAEASPDQAEIQKRFGPNAQILSQPNIAGPDQKAYFSDLPEELQNVLLVQLRLPGDVSAVIEAPTVFLLYVAKARTDKELSVAGLSLAKRSYDEWLAEQR